MIYLLNMKEFFSLIKRSIYDPIFYQELLIRPARFSVKYFLGLSLLLSVALTIALSLPIISPVNKFLSTLPGQVLAVYPDELVLHVEKGVLSSNVVEPYVVEIPSFWRGAMMGSGYTHLAVVDTSATVTPEQFAAYQTPLWLSRTNVIIADNNHGLRIQPYGAQTSFTLSEALVSTFLTHVEPYFVWVAPTIVLLLFVLFFTVLLFNVVYLLFGALLIFLLGRFGLKQDWNYGTAYRIGLHALTLPVLADVFLTMGSFSFHVFPFIPTVLLLLIVYVNYKPARRETGEVVLATPPPHEPPAQN